MNSTFETLVLMIVSAAAPVINSKVDEMAFEAGQKLQDHVKSTDNTLDDTALETAIVAAEALVRGIRAPRPAPAVETTEAPAADAPSSFQ